MTFCPEFIPSAFALGSVQSEPSGLLPISVFNFCLLIYGRQQMPYYATPIFLREGEMAGRLNHARNFEGKGCFYDDGKGRYHPLKRKKPTGGPSRQLCASGAVVERKAKLSVYSLSEFIVMQTGHDIFRAYLIPAPGVGIVSLLP